MANRRNQRGMTLVEIMTTVSIIAVIALVTIPSVARARIFANEGGAQKALISYRDAITNFNVDSAQAQLPSGLNDLALYVKEGLIPQASAVQAQTGGYVYTYEGEDPNLGIVYRIRATPETPDVTGERTFILDETGVVTEYPSLSASVFNSSTTTFPMALIDSAGVLESLLNSGLSEAEKTEILAGLIISGQESVDFSKFVGDLYAMPTPAEPLSFQLTVLDSQADAFSSLFGSAQSYLSSQLGIGSFGKQIDDVGFQVSQVSDTFLFTGVSSQDMPQTLAGSSGYTDVITSVEGSSTQYNEPNLNSGFKAVEIGLTLPAGTPAETQAKQSYANFLNGLSS